MEDNILASISEALNVDRAELTEVLKDGDNWREDAGEVLKQRFADKFESIRNDLKEKGKEVAENQYKRGQKEVDKKYRIFLRDLYGITDQFDTPEALFEATKEIHGNLGKSEITEETIKSNPFFIQQSNNWDNKLEELKSEYEGRIEAIQTEAKQKEVQDKVIGKALEYFDSYDYVKDDENPMIFANQRKEFINRIKSGKFMISEEGVPIPLNESGERLKDKLDNPISFEDIARGNIENYIPRAKSKPRSGGGGSGSENNYRGAVPKSKEEFGKKLQEMIANGASTGELTAFKNAYENSK